MQQISLLFFNEIAVAPSHTKHAYTASLWIVMHSTTNDLDVSKDESPDEDYVHHEIWCLAS